MAAVVAVDTQVATEEDTGEGVEAVHEVTSVVVVAVVAESSGVLEVDSADLLVASHRRNVSLRLSKDIDDMGNEAGLNEPSLGGSSNLFIA